MCARITDIVTDRSHFFGQYNLIKANSNSGQNYENGPKFHKPQLSLCNVVGWYTAAS